MFAIRYLLIALFVFPSYAQEKTVAPPVVYLGATLIDVNGGPPLVNTAIVVQGEKIEAVLDASTYTPAKDVRVVNVKGKYVIPGMIDSHVHLATPPNRAYALALLNRNIYGGVTAVRDMGDDARVMAGLAYGARFSEFPAPDIAYTALFAGQGFFDDPRVQSSSLGEVVGQVPWMREVNAVTELQQAVTLARGTGATAIKIYANLTSDLVTKIVDEAHRQQMPIWAHGAVFPATPMQVVQAGADSVSHICMLAYQAQKMPLTYHRRADVDESVFAKGMPESLNALFAEMKKRGTIMDATLFVYATIERMRRELPEGQGPPIYCSADLAGRLAKAAHLAGVEFSVGTDAPGELEDAYPALQHELELLVSQAGMTPLQALRSATVIGARSLNREAEMGSIEPGKLANMVFLNADPSKTITATRDVALTVKRGHEFKRSDYVPIRPEQLFRDEH